jgi:hypothetical protein
MPAADFRGNGMGAADDRVSELLDRWLASVELHARYLALDDAAYTKVQDWPRHQRPTRWIVDLARSRLVELKQQLAERGARGDASFADALELMAFLTSLLGSEHVERFIPLAVEGKGKTVKAQAAAPTPPEPRPAAPERPPTLPPPALAPAPVAEPVPQARATPKSKATTARSPGRAAAQPRAARRTEAAAAVRKASVPAAAKTKLGRHDATTTTVIADAVRLLNWGRPWPQLASLIARLADRPAEPEVWTILRAHRAEIDAQATPPSE